MYEITHCNRPDGVWHVLGKTASRDEAEKMALEAPSPYARVYTERGELVARKDPPAKPVKKTRKPARARLMEVIACLDRGMYPKEVAEALHMSADTVYGVADAIAEARGGSAAHAD